MQLDVFHQILEGKKKAVKNVCKPINPNNLHTLVSEQDVLQEFKSCLHTDVLCFQSLESSPFQLCISPSAVMALNENLLLMFNSDPPGCRGRQVLGELSVY